MSEVRTMNAVTIESEWEKGYKAAQEQWRNACALAAENAIRQEEQIVTLTRQLARVREEVERFRREFEASSVFDNFECEFGTTLGKCVESNHCVACSAKRLLDALPAKPT